MRSFSKTIAIFLLPCLLSVLKHDANAQTTVGLIRQDTGTTEDGYILFAPLNDTTTYLIDKCGRKVHTWHSSYRPGSSVYLVQNGNLLRPGSYSNPLFAAGGSGGIVEIMDWNSNVIASYLVSDSVYQQHHDVRVLPNGNILVLAWERKTVAQAITAGRDPAHLGTSVWSEAILELQPVNRRRANIVWEWHLWDHLVQDFDATKPNYGVVAESPEKFNLNFTPRDTLPDWLHMNSIDYNPSLDQVMINSPFFNELYIIDHSTTTAEAKTGQGGRYGKGGDILYRWGNPLAYGHGTEEDQQLFFQHNAHWIERGLPYENQIMIYNNGRGRTGGVDYSTVDVIIPPIDSDGNYDPNLPYGPASPELTYNKNNRKNMYSSFISGAQMLSNGNLLVCAGAGGDIFESNMRQNTVWQYISPVGDSGIFRQGDTPVNNLVFRATFHPVTYKGFEGQVLVPTTPIENRNRLSNQCSPPSLLISNARVIEGDDGTTELLFTVSLSAASADTVGVKYRTRNITATAPADYTAKSERLLFQPGDTLRNIRITVNGDLLPEEDERFAVDLLNPINGVIADSVGIGRINNDDAANIASSGELNAAENRSGKLVIYPNPVKNMLMISVPANRSIYALYLLDITGRVLKRIEINANKANYTIDMSAFAKGSYLLRAESKMGNLSAAFIKN